jgi:hypothetical protein
VGDGKPLPASGKSALESLLKVSSGTNLSEVMWLKSEIAAVETALATAGAPP